jgi:ribonuclease HII
MVKKLPDFSVEKELWDRGFTVIGIDEVGRGALAGPLGLGAVVFSPESDCERVLSFKINDSKKVPAGTRERLSQIILQEAHIVQTTLVEVKIINEIGIAKAFECEVQLLVNQIIQQDRNRIYFVLIDGNFSFPIENIQDAHKRSIIGGDARSVTIAAASILAKVHRDSYMKNLAKEYPEYGFERHVGYGTAQHRNAILQFGKTPHHRDLYLRKLLKQ